MKCLGRCGEYIDSSNSRLLVWLRRELWRSQAIQGSVMFFRKWLVVQILTLGQLAPLVNSDVTRSNLIKVSSWNVPKKTSTLIIDGTSGNLQLLGKDMSNVKSTTHLGIQRAVSGPVTMKETVSNNSQKARITCYSLMPAGLHGHNGLDPAIYNSSYLTKEEKYRQTWCFLEKKKKKKKVKQIMSLPTANPVIYILTGLLPVEWSNNIKTLNFFNNICLLPETTIEKRLATCQIAVKRSKSASWFIEEGLDGGSSKSVVNKILDN